MLQNVSKKEMYQRAHRPKGLGQKYETGGCRATASELLLGSTPDLLCSLRRSHDPSSGLSFCSKNMKDVLRYCCVGVWNYPCISRHNVSLLCVDMQCLCPVSRAGAIAQCLDAVLLLSIKAIRAPADFPLRRLESPVKAYPNPL